MTNIIIQQKIGTLQTFPVNNRSIDFLYLEWHETRKRILRKKTELGLELSMKFLNSNTGITEADILWENEKSIVVVSIIPCDCMVIKPSSLQEMAAICYEIGNKHLPLFFEKEELLIPYEAPLLRLLQASGYPVKLEKRKLLNAFKTSVQSHAHESSGETLFSKIMKITNPSG